LKYKYLYQDKNNQNCEGVVDARNRAEAYMRLRKIGIRPYRVIGDDPFDWRPLALSLAIFVAFMSVMVAMNAWVSLKNDRRVNVKIKLSPEEAREFRILAEEAVDKAPAAFRYNVWKGVNARLEERGLEPLPRPADLVDEDPLGLINQSVPQK
jgi:hypothetical protein